MLTIVHIIGSLRVAGIQRFVLDLAQQQVHSGDKAVVVALNGEPDPGFAASMEASGVSLVCLRKRNNRDVAALLRLLKVVRSHRADVVHTHGYTLTYGLPVATALGIPVVHTLHALMDVEVPAGTERFYDAAIALGIRFVAISTAVAASFAERFSSVAAVIDSGVNLRSFCQSVDQGAVRRRMGLPQDALVVVTVSRVEWVKGVDIAFDVIRHVAPQVPELHWIVAGDGAELTELRQTIAGSNVAQRVHTLGVVHDVPELLAVSDVFLLTSRSEGLGLSVIEALAAGVPCVVSPVGGLVEVVQHDQNGRLAANTSVKAIADELMSVCQSDSLRSRLAAGTRPSVERFAVSRAASLYRAVYTHPRTSRVRRAVWKHLPVWT